MKQRMRGELGKKWVLLFAVLWIAAISLLFAVIYKNQKETETENFELVNQQVISQLNNVMEQIDNLNEYIQNDDQLEILLTQRTLDPSELWSTRIAEYLNSRKNAADNVDGVLLLTDRGYDFANVGTMLRADVVREGKWYQDYTGMEVTRYYSPLADQYGDTEGEAKIYIMAAYPYETRSISGDLIFLCRFSNFREALKAYDASDTPVCVCGRDNQVLYTNAGSRDWLQEDCFPGILESLEGAYHSVTESGHGTFISDCTPIGGWKIVTELSPRYIVKSMLLAFAVGALVFTAIYVCVLVLAVSRQKIVRTEYAFLSAQINPHFIYKALNTIMFLCQRKENQQAVSATKALEDILKDKLRVDEVMIYDTIQRELEVIREYLTIQKIYYHFPILLEENVEECLMDEMIPKNILHPLVENALYHGILLNLEEDGSMKGGVIRIDARREKGELVLSVADDGVGMTPEQVKQVFFSGRKRKKERGMHIGIENIKDRLTYLKKLRYRMEVKSEPGKGTRVTLRFEMGKRNKN